MVPAQRLWVHPVPPQPVCNHAMCCAMGWMVLIVHRVVQVRLWEPVAPNCWRTRRALSSEDCFHATLGALLGTGWTCCPLTAGGPPQVAPLLALKGKGAVVEQEAALVRVAL